jgi:heptosyltransferase III
MNRNTVIIYRIGSLGDTLVSLPCFHLIARRFPENRRVLLTNLPIEAKAAAATVVLGESGLIHDHLNYSIGTRHAGDLAKLWLKIRRLNAKTLIYLAPSRGEQAALRDERFFRLCGVKQIIGLPLGDLATHRYDAVSGLYESEASRLARCVASLGDADLENPASWNPLLTSAEESRTAAAIAPLQGKPFLAMALASKMQATDWGIHNWRALMPGLYREFPDHAAVFIGAREDRDAIESVASEWAGQSLNLAGALPPRESACVIKRCSLFLGLDSGPMHLAASVGATCVAIFSARNLPGIWFPYGSNHQVIYHKTDCFGCNLEKCVEQQKKCIQSISTEEVIRAAVRARSRLTGIRPLTKSQSTRANAGSGAALN